MIDRRDLIAMAFVAAMLAAMFAKYGGCHA
jgi:hypothetical protein